MVPSFQEIILALHRFWTEQGCLLVQPYDVEVGAGTMNPMTFLRVLGPEPWRVAYVEPSRRPADARYGENPNRLYQHHQYQVILKPAPEDVVDVYLDSLRALGLDLGEHDVRLVEDNWEAPTLGAWGLGWEIWLDGMEITQFTYFQQVGGLELNPIAVEITYGLERIAAYLQGKDDVFSVEYGSGVVYGEIFRTAEYEHSKYSFEVADVELLGDLFATYEREARRVLDEGLVLPAYDYVLRMSHTFNVLDARGAVSVSERAGLIARVRRLANEVSRSYVAQREALGYPLLRAEAKSA